MIGLGLVSLGVAEGFGFAEFTIVAIMCGVLVALALLILLVPTRVKARLLLNPGHTVAGQPVQGILRATNQWPIRLNRPLVVVPLDPRAKAAPVSFRTPPLKRGVTEEVRFEIPGLRRGVLQVGPAGTRRTDPLGFFTRQSTWAKPVELWVRPEMAAVESLGPGFVRDLEGVPSDEISMSDLAFHALREYVRGDDLRHVHWRSSARTGALHVRQYHDTRRSHVVVIVDDDRSAYADPEDFELALSIAASVVVRVALDEFDLTYSCGPELITATARDVLDATCVAELGRTDLVLASQMASRQAADASQVVLITGAQVRPDAVAEVRSAFGEHVRFLGFRAEHGVQSRRPWDEAGLLYVPHLSALPGVLAAYVRGVRL